MAIYRKLAASAAALALSASLVACGDSEDTTEETSTTSSDRKSVV